MSVRDRWIFKLQRMNKWILRLARNCLAICNPRKVPRVEHMIGRWRVMPGCLFHNYLLGKANLRKSFFGKNLFFALPSLYSYYIYSHYPLIARSAFQRENLRKFTWELEIVIPTIIYSFPCGFPQVLPLHLYIFEKLLS